MEMKLLICTLLAVLAIMTEGTKEGLRGMDQLEESTVALTPQMGDVTRNLVSYFWCTNDILCVRMEDNQRNQC